MGAIKVLLINEGETNYNQELKDLLLSNPSDKFSVVDISHPGLLDGLLEQDFDMVLFNSNPIKNIDHIEYLDSSSNIFILHTKHSQSYNCGKVLYRMEISDIATLPSDLSYCLELSRLKASTNHLISLRNCFKDELHFIKEASHCGVPKRT